MWKTNHIAHAGQGVDISLSTQMEFYYYVVEGQNIFIYVAIISEA